jgi:tellurite resistance protein
MDLLKNNDLRRRRVTMSQRNVPLQIAAGVTGLLLAFAAPSIAQDKPAGAAPKKPATKVVGKKSDDKNVADKQGGDHEQPGEKQTDKKLLPRKTDADASKSREEAALKFVRENHAELESLLTNLKERQPKQYDAAIRDLYRHSERLGNAKAKDVERYELELKAWKLQSRVQLLTASLLMTPEDESAKSKLKDALVEQLRSRRELLQFERDQAAKRMERLDEQLKKLDADFDQTAERQLRVILQGSPRKVKVSN